MPDDCWDRAAQSYVDFWVPRLIPYYEALVRKSAPRPRDRVLVTSVGPGAELLSVAKAMNQEGTLVATDPCEAMLEHARQAVAAAELRMPIEFVQTEAHNTLTERWDLIFNAFSLWQLPNRIETLQAWGQSLSEMGQVSLLVWGPPDPDGPFELVGEALEAVAPELGQVTKARELAAREPMAEMLKEAGLRLVRHAIVRYPMEFGSAQGFFNALCNGCSFLRACDRLGAERMTQVADAFYERLAPPSSRTPLVFAPAAAIALAQPA